MIPSWALVVGATVACRVTCTAWVEVGFSDDVPVSYVPMTLCCSRGVP